ncbi:hypothetical protein LCGC14_2516120 [marine sediment metagenome]|uniref:Uncharacterized protein n=1 Tax=marine sediment metagenome TaxID=412755 RepID=A0A0F9BKP6_9ZZZZ
MVSLYKIFLKTGFTEIWSVEFASPVGIEAAASIEYDASVPWNLGLEVIGRDLLGLDQLIQLRHGHETGDFHGSPIVYSNRPETPGAALSSLIFRAHNIVVTLSKPNDNAETMGGNTDTSNGVDFQTITLDQPTKLLDIVVRTRRVGTSNKTARLKLRNTTGSNNTPDPNASFARVLVGPTAWSVAVAGLGTAFGELAFFQVGSNLELAAGVYAVQYYISAGSTGEAEWSRSTQPIYSKGSRWEIALGVAVEEPGLDHWVALLDATVDNQPEVAGETGEVLTMNDILVKFDGSRTPLVTKQSDEDAYYIDTSIKRSTVDEIRVRFLDRWIDIDTFSVLVDVGSRTARGSRFNDELRPAVSFTSDDWLIIPSGAHTIDAVPNLEAEDEDLALKFRDSWQS